MKRNAANEEIYVPKSILVTGGAGFIASHVAIRLCKTHPNTPIVVLDKLDYCSSLKNLEEVSNHKHFKFVKGDIRSPDLVSYVLKSEKIDTICHLAAQSHVDNSFGNSLQFTENNVIGTHVLLECAKVHGIRRFVHISTDEVYGEIPAAQDKAHETETVLAPTNPYAATKAAAEYLVLAYHKSFKLPVIITRGNNVYGPHQFPEKIVPKFALLLAAKRPVPVHGDGSHKRSFLYVTDVAAALDLIMQKGTVGQMYNIGTDFELSNLDVAKQLCDYFKLDSKQYIQFAEDRPFNDCRYAIDSSKLHALGWQPKVSWKDGLKQTVDWYISRTKDHWDAKNVDAVLIAHPRIGENLSMSQFN